MARIAIDSLIQSTCIAGVFGVLCILALVHTGSVLNRAGPAVGYFFTDFISKVHDLRMKIVIERGVFFQSLHEERLHF
jgi:hypothetical protein